MSLFPSEVLVSAAIYHLPTTGGMKQPYPGTADLTVTGALLPMDRQAAVLESGSFVESYELYLDPTVDIRVADQVIINTVTYYVKHLFKANFGDLAHIRASISTQK